MDSEESAGADSFESSVDGAKSDGATSAELPGAGGTYRIMGVVNVTPDSFSDGGLYLDPAAAVEHAIELANEGAAILDVGGESTRPGAEPVSAEEELRRVLPVIEGLVAAGVRAQISIDTSKAAVAAAALNAGATLVNDVTAFRSDPGIASLVAASGADCCLMHMLGEPRTMQREPRYEDVVSEVKAFLEQRMASAISAGVADERILLDPGIGFGKTGANNLELLSRLDEIVALGRPVVVGTSRKSFLGRLAGGRATDERLAGTIATNVMAYERGASVFRVHDVRPVHDALAVAAATVRAGCRSTTTPTSSTTSTKALTRATRNAPSPR
ncbi:MAG: dihydropteroate synthase [Actinomycetota bacterium]|nr:dihydropteroate synthase [Actinomycetota bacterium]